MKNHAVSSTTMNSALISSSKSQWSQLPSDILTCIAELLSLNAADSVRFGAVCRSWRAVPTEENYLPANHLPWLMLAEHKPNSKLRCFFSPSESKIYELPLPEARGRRCCGSAGGWLVAVGLNSEMYLLNPMSRARIPLPSLDTFNALFDQGRDLAADFKRSYFVPKVCLPSAPSKKKDRRCIAVAFYGIGWKLVFARLGDRSWTTVSSTVWWPYYDAVYYKGQFYIISRHGAVLVLDIQRRRLTKVASKVDGCLYGFPWGAYLVECNGDLLQLVRNRWPINAGNTDNYKTDRFSVFKLVGGNSGEWEKVKTLGDRSIIVGFNTSMSVAASKVVGCRPNCIYFTDDHLEGYDHSKRGGGYDMGIYSLEDGRVEPHYKGLSLSEYSPPLWVAPFLWWQQ